MKFTLVVLTTIISATNTNAFAPVSASNHHGLTMSSNANAAFMPKMSATDTTDGKKKKSGGKKKKKTAKKAPEIAAIKNSKDVDDAGDDKKEKKTVEVKSKGKEAGDDAPPVSIGWDSHQAVNEIPESLVREGESGPDGNYPMRSKFEKMIREAQISITKAIEDIDGEAQFQEDAWVRANGGGGMSRVMSGGKVFEKAGVNLSVVYGSMPQEALQAATERGVDRAKGMKPGERVPFFACGLSSVMHPRNPHCPTMHFNYRYFETDGGVWWFGGGTDITPSYINEDDMKHFHGSYKEVCDNHDEKFYPEFKAWADKYFVIQHRNETRGLGGIFFDDLNDRDPDTIFEFSKEALNNVVNAYGPIIEKHKDDPYTDEEKTWQLTRRGRYVEFNLVYDRGTVFGLKTGGRIESILMSLPETANWLYDFHPEEGTREYDFIQACKYPRDWV